MDLLALAEAEPEDTELIPEILPVDARLSVSGEVSAFLSCLTSVVSVTPSKEVLPNTSFIRIEAEDSDSSSKSFIRMSATDGDRTITRISRQPTVNLAGEALIPGKKLLDILRLVPSALFRLDVFATTATVRAGRAVWTIQLPSSTHFPAFPDLEGMNFHEVDRQELIQGLEVANMATATSSARMSLTQIQISKQIVVGCDGARSHRWRMESLPKSFSTTMPSSLVDSILRELRSYAGETVQLASTSQTVAVKLGDDVVTGQRLTLTYPNIEHLMLEPAMLNTESLILSVSDLREAILRVRVNADPDVAAVYLAIRSVKSLWTVTVRAVDKIGNSSQETLDAEYLGEGSKEYAFNQKYLLDFLKCIESESTELKLGTDKKAPLYVSFGNFTGVLMPMALGFMQ